MTHVPAQRWRLASMSETHSPRTSRFPSFGNVAGSTSLTVPAKRSVCHRDRLHPPGSTNKLAGTVTWFPSLCILLASICASVSASADTLVVGVREAPPFVVRNADGSLDGISIRLWAAIASELELRYEFKEKDLRGLLDGLTDGSLDVAVAALTVTPERERLMDFSHPFHASGLGIAVAQEPGGVWATVGAVLSWRLVHALGALALVLLVVGLVIWLLERRANPGQFGGKPQEGIGAGFWWSAVTMTTVGYGDKAPVTPAGRAVAVIWMFASIITISGFTAAIASALTVERLSSHIQGPNDLPGSTVATVTGSTSAEYLTQIRTRVRHFDTPREALASVARSEADAAVYDKPIMRYLSGGELLGQVDVLPVTFMRQDYALGLKAGSPLREDINRALLKHIASPAWDETMDKYLGP